MSGVGSWDWVALTGHLRPRCQATGQALWDCPLQRVGFLQLVWYDLASGATADGVVYTLFPSRVAHAHPGGPEALLFLFQPEEPPE